MILPTDIPTRAEIDRLLEHRNSSSVSIYLPTDPASNGDPERIEFKTLAAQATSQLSDAGTVRDRDIPGQGAVAAILRYPAL